MAGGRGVGRLVLLPLLLLMRHFSGLHDQLLLHSVRLRRGYRDHYDGRQIAE